jgi:hypothetical protein
MTEKTSKPIPDDIYDQLRCRADYNAERRCATAIFRALKMTTADRSNAYRYCVEHGVIPAKHAGYEPQVAVYCLKVAVRLLRNNIPAQRVKDYVLCDHEYDWYFTGVYPIWDGSVTAMLRTDGYILYAVHEDDLTVVPLPFSANAYEGDARGERVYLIRQGIVSYVGEMSEHLNMDPGLVRGLYG